jgi:hypothetical protein
MGDELKIEEEPRREDVAVLDERLYEFNARATGVDDGRWLAIFVRDDVGTIMAGMHGWTWGGTGFVQAIWVHEKLRGHGLGPPAGGRRSRSGSARLSPDAPRHARLSGS